MAESERRDARKNTLMLSLLTAVVLVLLLVVIVFRGCQDSNVTDDRINPNDPLPGAQDGTGYHAAPDAVPLLRAA